MREWNPGWKNVLWGIFSLTVLTGLSLVVLTSVVILILVGTGNAGGTAFLLPASVGGGSTGIAALVLRAIRALALEGQPSTPRDGEPKESRPPPE